MKKLDEIKVIIQDEYRNLILHAIKTNEKSDFHNLVGSWECLDSSKVYRTISKPMICKNAKCGPCRTLEKIFSYER